MIQLEKMKGNKKLIIIILFIIILVTIDQISKIIISGREEVVINDTLKIAEVKNYEGTFGVGQNDTITFIITNIIVIGIIVRFIRVQEKQIDKKTHVSLTLVIAGALGNLIDRVIRGYVIKIISIKSIAFNIADILIIVGWTSLALFFAIHTVKLKNKKEDKIE